jgi:hypothetical protein
MNDGVQVLQAAFFESDFGKSGAVEAAIGGEYLRAELRDDLIEDLVAGFHEVAAQRVGFDDYGAESAQHGGYGGFAAAETAGQAYA